VGRFFHTSNLSPEARLVKYVVALIRGIIGKARRWRYRQIIPE
jgi:hypothetical protein